MINWTDFELNAIILKKKKEDFASSRSVPFGSDKNTLMELAPRESLNVYTHLNVELIFNLYLKSI